MKKTKIRNRIWAGIIAASLCVTNLIPAYASGSHAARSIGIDEELKNQLTSDQYFVYQLNKVMEKKTFSMNAALVDDNYIDNKTSVGLQGGFSFNDLGKGFLGTYEEDYYKGVMAECITIGTELIDEKSASEDLYDYINEELFDGLLENEEVLVAIGNDTARFIQDFMTVKDYVDGAYETGQLLEKIAYYSASHLNALELVEKNSEQNSSLYKAANYVTKAANSKTYRESYYAWIDEYLGSASNITVDACISILTGGFSDLVAATNKALTGNKYEKEMNELFYLNLQNAIRSAYNSVIKDKQNVLTAHYTHREMKDLAEMKKIIRIVIPILCLIYVTGCSKKETLQEENLIKYGTEYAECEYPSEEIAWDLLRCAEEEFQAYDIELNPQSVELEPTKISEFDEKLELSAICCQPSGDYLVKDGMYSSGTLWIRTGWSTETSELRNIFISFHDDYMDSLVFNIFHNSNIEGLSEIYDKLNETESIELNGYEMRIVDNVVALYFEDNVCNIEFLPHNVHVENGKLFYSTGKEVNLDFNWGHNVIN